MTKKKTKAAPKPEAAPISKRGKGQPPKPYYPDRHPEWVRGLSSRGSTIQEICTALGISKGTLYAWEKKHPDFLAALQVGRNETLARVHNSWIRRAEGFSKPTVDKQVIVHQDGTKTQRVTERTEYFPPDVGAIKLVMLNYDPTFKTERTEQEITGKDGGPVQITSLSDAELLTKIKSIAAKKLKKPHD